MNTKSTLRTELLLYLFYFALFGGLLAYATFYDLQVSERLFNPQNNFGIFFEYFAEVPRYVLRGCAFTVLLFTRHSLNECLEIIGRIFPFIRPFSREKAETKLFRICDQAFNWIEIIGFGVLAFFGWKMETDSLVKYIIVWATGRPEGEVSGSALCIACSIVLALILTGLGFFIASRARRETLNKLEPLALLGLFLYVLYPLLNDIKAYISRVRFREMVGYSNGFLTAEGLSNGTDPGVVRDMIGTTDFGAFTRWYERGDAMGIYSHADSFPSGHTGSAVFILLSYYLCRAFDSLKKFAVPCFLGSTLYIGLMAVARIMRGAHYLSDVSMAALLCGAFLLTGGLLMRFLTYRRVFPTRDLGGGD